MSAAFPLPSFPFRPPPALVAERLEAAVHAEGWGGPPLLVCLGDDPTDGGSSSRLPPVESITDDPVADLLGYVVPADCGGLAVVAEGSGRRLGAQPGGDPAGQPFRLAYALDRRGRAASAVRPMGGEPVIAESGDGDRQAPAGRLVDVCHRALGLPTAAAPDSTSELWMLSWLDVLLAHALGQPRKRGWAEVAALHPVILLLEESERQAGGSVGLDDPPADPSVLARMGVALGRAQCWDELRRATAAGVWSPHGIIATDAAWMDAGMFARWVTGEFLPVSVYLGELSAVFPGPVMVGVREVADAAMADR